LAGLALVGLAACEKPAVYNEYVASCDDELRRTRQVRAVSGDDPNDVRAKSDAVALSEYFVERCFPNPYRPPAADQPAFGKVSEIIDYQRRVHNANYPHNPI
jgi:hypothetical protein